MDLQWWNWFIELLNKFHAIFVNTCNCGGYLGLNTLRPKQNGRPFCRRHIQVHLNENCWISITISQKYVPGVKLTIRQHWFRWLLGTVQAPSHYLPQWWKRLRMHICATRHRLVDDLKKRWVNSALNCFGMYFIFIPILFSIYIFCLYLCINASKLWSVRPIHDSGWVGGGGVRFKNTYELLNLRALNFSPMNKIFHRMGKIFCVEFLWNSTENILPINWKIWFS